MNEQRVTAEGILIRMPPANPAYWPGARLLAVLAFPPAPGKAQRWRDAEAMFGRSLMLHRIANDPGWDEHVQPLVPRHALISAAHSEKLQAQVLEKLFHDRMGAAHVAYRLFEEADRVARGLSERQRRKTFVDQEIIRTLSQEEDRVDTLRNLGINASPRFQQDVNNFDNRVLRVSLPVLHIALAVASLIDESRRELRDAPRHEQDRYPIDVGGPQIGYRHFLDDPTLAARAVAYAQHLETLLPHFSRLQPSPRKVVRLRQD